MSKPEHSDYLFSDDVYQVLKWLGLIVIPALSTLVSTLGTIWGWSWASPTSATITAIGVFIGAAIGISQSAAK